MLWCAIFYLAVVHWVLALNEETSVGLDFGKLRPLVQADRIGSDPVFRSGSLFDPSAMQSSTVNVRRGSYIAKVISFPVNLMEEEKWRPVDMQKYSGNDPEITGKTLFANPYECRSFLINGQISVSEYIRHHNTLAANGLWPWTDEDFELALHLNVGKVYFHHMGNLNWANLEDLVTTSLTAKIKYLDYPTECKLRKLLDKEHRDGDDGLRGREDLRNHREFYKAWGEMLFGDLEIEIPTAIQAFVNETSEGMVMTATSQGSKRHHREALIVLASLVYLLIHV